MPKKPATPNLDDLWDLEDKFTAFVGVPTGAKILQTPKSAKGTATSEKARKASMKVDIESVSHGLKTALKTGTTAQQKHFGTIKTVKLGGGFQTAKIVGGIKTFKMPDKMVVSGGAQKYKFGKLTASKKAATKK